ncbi:MAG: proton-conducting transporter membrane subunit [Candidatus Sedimenticola sp. PURPLELP]
MSGYAWLIPLLPLLAAALIAITYIYADNRGEKGEKFTSAIAVGAALISTLLTLLLDLQALINGVPGQVELFQWLSVGKFQLDISLTLDSLGLVMTTLVAILSLLTLKFSVNYMHREAGFQRFFIILSLFMGAMLLIVMGGSLAMVFIGWELAGVSSYLLIGYALERPTATGNATRAFVTNRIGDAGFILGIFLTYLWLGDVDWPTIAAGSGQLETLNAGLLGAGFLLAALVKSGQVPFSAWITRALEGPTPSSAIFYGSLMVHAGVYLVIRLEPVFLQAPAMMVLLILFGLVTMLYGWLSGLVQTDVKSSLMLSTTAQVGMMFLECGLGLFELATWHLVLHAIWRAYQFLHAPALMHLVSRSARPAPAWLTRSRRLYTAALQRFWLDQIADWLLVRPTRSLARDTRDFDEQVVSRIVGLPSQVSAISSLAEWQQRKKQGYISAEGEIGRGRGVFGHLMEWIASLLHWFEEHLVLQSSGDGVTGIIRNLGWYVLQIEKLLAQPRYLMLLIMATFVVIL